MLRQLNRSVKVRERRQHDFSRTFIVTPAAADTLVVERQGEGGARREGFVLDVPALVSTIQSWVLSAQGLGDVALLYAAGTKPKPTLGADVFTHRLAMPLDSQSMSLRLRKLDDEDASTTLYGLAALLAAAAISGCSRCTAWSRCRCVSPSAATTRRRRHARTQDAADVIRMYGEMLRDGMVSDEQVRKEYYATITAEGERLTRLINNVMEHGKLRQGQRLPELAQCQVADVVREVVELMTPHIEHEGFDVEAARRSRLAAGPRSTPMRSSKLLFNVIDNALKYGRGAVAASDRSRVATVELRTAWRCGVRDHAPGRRGRGERKRFFEPFFRGGERTHPAPEGHGHRPLALCAIWSR